LVIARRNIEGHPPQKNLNAGREVNLTAGADISLTGTNIEAVDDIALNAGGDATISVAQDESYTYYKKVKKKSFGRKKTTIIETFNTTTKYRGTPAPKKP
jgi:hypothetical protein